MDPGLPTAYQMDQVTALRGMQFPLVSAASFDASKMKAMDFRTENMQILEQQSQQTQQSIAGESSQRSILEVPLPVTQNNLKCFKSF